MVVQNTHFKDKVVLVRVEYNVPLNKKGGITDTNRIDQSIPTIKKLLSYKPKQIILMTHLGRPKNQEKELKTDVVAKALEKKIGQKVTKVDDWGELGLPKNKIVMLENLRFHPGEKSGDGTFAKHLARLADIYVNESFGTSHRKDASMYAVPKLFKPEHRFKGLLLEKEVEKLQEVSKSKSLCVLVGFAKIKDKLEILTALLEKADTVLIGGAVAFSFLKAKGFEVGKSLCDDPETAKKLLKQYSKKIVLPVDIVGTYRKQLRVYDVASMTKEFIGLDIGPESVALFSSYLDKSSLVFWNGPTGKFEEKPFDQSTKALAKHIAKQNIKTVVGGGDTAYAISKTRYSKDMYHISTGGGASLAFIEKGKLDAISLVKQSLP
ncbi:MAG: phosphoglycerate kinase [Candidatus Woesearchaeota archaeon]